MSRWRKGNKIVEAFRWNSGIELSGDPAWITDAVKAGRVRIYKSKYRPLIMDIDTPDGKAYAYPGDWVIKDSVGVINAVDHDVFVETFVAATNEALS